MRTKILISESKSELKRLHTAAELSLRSVNVLCNSQSMFHVMKYTKMQSYKQTYFQKVLIKSVYNNRKFCFQDRLVSMNSRIGYPERLHGRIET